MEAVDVSFDWASALWAIISGVGLFLGSKGFMIYMKLVDKREEARNAAYKKVQSIEEFKYERARIDLEGMVSDLKKENIELKDTIKEYGRRYDAKVDEYMKQYITMSENNARLQEEIFQLKEEIRLLKEELKQALKKAKD